MIPAAFDYVRAESVDDAIALLTKHGEDAKLLAGGQSLIPMMKLRFAAPATLIDLRTIPGLRGVSVSGGRITIGALTNHATIAADEILRAQAPVLWEAANVLGDPQVRNLGTIGGSLAHADPAADYPAAMAALDAELTIVGPQGERKIKIGDFFQGMFETALGEREVLTAITFASAPRSAYVKFHHPASHYAVVGAAAVLALKGDTIEAARVAITGVFDQAFRASHVEEALRGINRGDAKAIGAACTGVAGPGEARGDTFASSSYRKAMADVFAARAVQAAGSTR